MKIFARAVVLVMAFFTAILLSSCGDDGTVIGTVDDSKAASVGAAKAWYLGGHGIFSEKLDVEELFENIPDNIDPQQIYSKTILKEDMLHGAYTLNNIEKDPDKIKETIPFADVDVDGNTYSLSTLPIAVYFGADYICGSLTNYGFGEYKEVADAEVAVIELLRDDGKHGGAVCTYEIEGNSLVFKQIRQSNAEDAPFAYDFTGLEFRFEFEICGPYLTLKKDGSFIKLISYCMSESNTSGLSMDGYSLPDSPLIGELDYFASADAWNYAVRRDGTYFDLAAYKLSDDGRFTLYLADKDLATQETEEFISQYAYIIQSDSTSFLASFSIVLLDGERAYYYTDNISKREARILKDEGIDVNEINEDDLKKIAEKKADLFDDLQKEFETRGINVSINRATGEISMDASVLFGGDSAEITTEGKSLLDKFLAAYSAIIYNEKYDGFISKTMIEGHTALLEGSTYESGLPLSQERADNVRLYCLSGESDVDITKLGSTLESVGCSNSRPIYNSDGTVNKEASRRVSFRFIVNTNNN